MRNLSRLSWAALPVLAFMAACASEISVPAPGPQDDSTIWTQAMMNEAGPNGFPVSLDGVCLKRAPTVDAEGLPACVVLEGHHEGGACPPCEAADARLPVSTAHKGVVDLALVAFNPTAQGAIDCFCEIPLLQGAGEAACQSDTSNPVLVDGVAQDGICYVDATTTPGVGNPALAAHCPQTDQRLLHLVGKGESTPTASSGPVGVFVWCEGEADQAP